MNWCLKLNWRYFCMFFVSYRKISSQLVYQLTLLRHTLHSNNNNNKQWQQRIHIYGVDKMRISHSTTIQYNNIGWPPFLWKIGKWSVCRRDVFFIMNIMNGIHMVFISISVFYLHYFNMRANSIGFAHCSVSFQMPMGDLCVSFARITPDVLPCY